MLYFIGEKPLKANHAGNKARLDIDCIFRNRSYIEICNLEQIEFKSIFQKVRYMCNWEHVKNIITIYFLHNKNVVLQYPFYFNVIIRKAIFKLLNKNNTILFIHDIDALRKLEKSDLEREIKILNNAKVVVLHNEKMRNILIQNGLKAKVVILSCFDYLLTDNSPIQNYKLSKEVVFAGNLAKSTFLTNNKIENLNLIFNLYGPNFNKKEIRWQNIKYFGSFSPNEVPYKLKGSFGLIWDGEKIDTCSGSYGEYMKYNNPHKLSLYIAAGLPVIVWKKSAIAQFVEINEIGITVNSLEEINNVIDKMDINTYNEYKNNIKLLQTRITSGYYTQKVLEKCEKIIDEVNINEK